MFTFGISSMITDDKDVFAAVEIIKKSSFNTLEIRCEKEHFNYEDIVEIKKLKTLLKKTSLSVSSLHPPIWINIAHTDEWTRVKSVREVEKIILVAKRLNVQKIILHPGKITGNMEKAFLSIVELVSFAEEWETKLIVENTSPEDFGSRIDEIKTISDKFDLPVCIDTSHASANKNILNKLLKTFDGKIEHFHLSDSKMKGSDDHLIPYEGKINWKPVVNFMKAHEGIGIFEIPIRENTSLIEKLEKITNQWKN